MAGRITSYQRDGLRFDVLDEGPADGTLVVLLHGFPQLNTSWRKVAPLLHDAGFRTLAPNQRGYSPGARPLGRRPYKISELVGDVATLVDEAGGPVHLVGHDWGAAVAWATAMTRPELVRSLTAVSVPHPGAFMKAMPRGQVLQSWYMAMFNVPVLPERFMTRGSDRLMRHFGMSDELVADFRRDFGERPTGLRTGGSRLSAALGWYRAMALGNPKLFGVHVSVPTTYVWSDHDTALGRVGAALCAEYVDGPYRFEVLEGVSHWIPDERPDDLARMVIERANAAV